MIMPHTYYKIWIHLIWSTKDRSPFLTKDIRNMVFIHMKEKAQENGVFLDALNGTTDHVHGLLGLVPNQNVARIVNDLKGESSHWINEEKLTGTYFAWQQGYSAFSYGESQVHKVREYIENQEEHHRTMTFQEELERFLKEFKVDIGRP
jgi:putative transposase